MCPKLEVPTTLHSFPGIVYDTNSFITQEVELQNASRYLLNYKFETATQSFIDNAKGIPAFSYNPKTGDIEGSTEETENEDGSKAIVNTSRKVQISFRPHRPFEIFREKVLVNVPNQDWPTYLYLYGHCFRYQMFVIYDLKIEAFATGCDTTSQFVDGANRTRECKGTDEENAEELAIYNDSQRKELFLTFEDVDDEEVERSTADGGDSANSRFLYVGCCAPPGASGKNAGGDFEKGGQRIKH